MANSGWVRWQGPAGVHVQVSIQRGLQKSGPIPLGATGGGNLFSAWVCEEVTDTDTVFYLINHAGQDVTLAAKWHGPHGEVLSDTTVPVPAGGLVIAPASAYLGA